MTIAGSFHDRRGLAVHVRPAHEDDAAAIIAFVKQVDAESLFLSREPGEFNASVTQQRLLIKQMAARRNSLYLLALHEGSLVATIDFHGGTRSRTQHAGEFGMCVLAAHWGQGIGGHLLDALLAWAAANGVTRRVKLRVHALNDRAIALYRSRGFEPEGTLQRELYVRGAWVDLIMMARWLEPGAGSP